MPTKSKSRKQSRALVKRRKHSSRRMRGGDMLLAKPIYANCDMLLAKRIDAELDHMACLLDIIEKDDYLSTLFGSYIVSSQIGIEASEEAMKALENLGMMPMMPKATIEVLNNTYNSNPASPGPLLLTNAPRNKNGKVMMGGETPEERAARLQREADARAQAEQAALAERMRLQITANAINGLQRFGNAESARGYSLSMTGMVGGLVGGGVIGIAGAILGGPTLGLSIVLGGIGVSAMSIKSFSGDRARGSGRETGVSILIAMLNSGTSPTAAALAIKSLSTTELARINAAVKEAQDNNKTIKECTQLVTAMVTTIATKTVESSEKVLTKGVESTQQVLVSVGNNVEKLGTEALHSTEKVFVAVAPGINKLAEGGGHLLTKGGDALEQAGKDAGTFANNFSKPLGEASGKVLEAVPTGMGNLLKAGESAASALHQNARNVAIVARQDLGQGVARVYGNTTTAAGRAIGTVYTDTTTAVGNVGRTAASSLAAALNRRRQAPQGNGSGSASGDPTSMKKSNL